VSGPSYTRYTLRLSRAAGAGAAASRRRDHGVGDIEDWSGQAASRVDAQAVDYAHPQAVDAVLALQPAGWQEQEDGDVLVFWLPQGAERDPKTGRRLADLGSLGRLSVDAERPGWEDGWRRFHRPQEVGRLWVRPPWYPSREDLLDVVVEAGMAFGTGGHASTRQCLEEVQELPPSSLLDLGCGSGVVSFAALRLGFAPVTGIDIDPVAVRAAAGNAALNALSPVLLIADATEGGYPLPVADVVVANIALRPIVALGRRFAAGELALPRHLVLAGLLVEQAGEALAAYPGWTVRSRREDDPWLLLRLEPPS
jgi:ribosomal protein L11 methyltransferase